MLKKMSITRILLFFTILSLENFCCLIPSENYIISNTIKYSDLGIIISIIFFIWVMFFVKFKDKKEKTVYPYKYLIIAFVILIIISSAMATHFYGQPISWGIRSHRKIITCFLLYFPMSKALQTGVLNKKDIIKDIVIIATIEMFLFTIQYLIIDKIVFLNFVRSDSIDMRIGRRLRYPIELPLLSSLIFLDNFFNNKENRIKCISYIVWFVIIMVVMVQKRTQIFSLLIAIIISFIFWKKDVGTKFVFSILMSASLAVFLLNSSLIQSAIDGVIYRGSVNDTLTIRENGINYYIEKTKESQLFGFGAPNENSVEATLASGVKNGFYLADDGIYGFYYIFGISGIVWLLLFWVKNFKFSYNLLKKQNYLLISYFLYESADLLFGMKWYYYWPLAMSLFIILLSNENIIQQNKEGRGYVET